MSAAFAILAAWFAYENASLKLGMGVLVLLVLSWTSLQEWLRICTMVLAVHEGGISMVTASGQRIDLLFDEILSLEARYVPGMWKKGLADEGNRVSLHVFSSRDHVSIPREMEGFLGLGGLLVNKTGLLEKRVLIEGVSAR